MFFFLGIYGLRSYAQSFNPLELIFVYGERQGSSLSLLNVDIQFFQHHLLKRLFILLYIFGTHDEDQLTVYK